MEALLLMLADTRKLLMINPVRNRKQLRNLDRLEDTLIAHQDEYADMNMIQKLVIHAQVDALRFMAFTRNFGDLN